MLFGGSVFSRKVSVWQCPVGMDSIPLCVVLVSVLVVMWLVLSYRVLGTESPFMLLCVRKLACI